MGKYRSRYHRFGIYRKAYWVFVNEAKAHVQPLTMLNSPETAWFWINGVN